ncbi:uncharacterized protein LOC121868113 [Homarus americanus]|uniref:Importin subunit alpha-5-like 1 n=1 Tax=Homarus americanus TaxID=6706 RepID=A0A8J5K143_HOMAM|nr:uncharacterized protein LOC121868113 [Homarus americanus]XP_042224328.1 uncharacterized protein LOC121868113 [Homarus americanus]KAG7167637.1 Importin subunit alpha-5-like 1 [Homarus americanus]
MAPNTSQEAHHTFDEVKRVTSLMVAAQDNSDEDQLKVTRQLRILLTSPFYLQYINHVLQTLSLSRVVRLLDNDNNWELQNEAAWILCNIAAGNRLHTQAVVDAGAVPILIRLLSSQSTEVLITAVWALANVAGGSPANVNVILAEDIFTPLLQKIDMRHHTLGITVSWFLKNICQGKDPVPAFSQLVPCLPLICRLIFHTDDQVVDDACEAFVCFGVAHTHRFLAALHPTFCSRIADLHKSKPHRHSIAEAVKTLEKLEGMSDAHEKVTTTHDSADKQTYRQDSSPLSCSACTPGTPKNSSITKDFQKPAKRRSRSPSPVGVSTRTTAKIFRSSPDVCNKAAYRHRVIKTRASARKLFKIAPDHSAANIYQKQAEVFKAVEAGDLENVEELLHDTGPAVITAQTGCTLLHAAVANNQPHVVLFLLKLISPNIVNKEGQTPAHVAAMKGHTQVLRILLSDKELKHDKQDNCYMTYKELLAAPLFEAVLHWDANKIDELIKLGADPDYHVGRLVDGVLARELRVTTARQLAHALQRDAIVPMFPQRNTVDMKNNNCCKRSYELLIGDSPQLANTKKRVRVSPQVSIPDVYKMDTDPRGYVCVLNYSSFKDRPDLALEGSHSDVTNLTNVFSKMGYTGHAYTSLSAEKTKQVLTKVRDMEVLDHVGCAVFIISSHGIGNEKFLTGDMKLLTTEWVCDLFKDSECTRLKNKPKLFIFDFCCGFYQNKSHQVSIGKCRRVEEPLQDTMCLYSNGGDIMSYSINKEGTPFITALCRTLAHHAHHMEFGDLYRELLNEHTKTFSPSTPHLRNFSFKKKFYFSSVFHSDGEQPH